MKKRTPILTVLPDVDNAGDGSVCRVGFSPRF